jgi:hypothetical protein
MQRISYTLAGLLLGLLLAVAPARAYTPESGLWWNPAEPGTGLTIEVQDNLIAVLAFVYEPNGAVSWYLATGLLTGNARFDGVLDGYEGGQCIGCPWRSNTGYAGLGGPIRIDFNASDPTRATLTWGGRTQPIERMGFYLKRPEDERRMPGVRPALTKLLGEWQAVLDFSGNPAAAADYYGEVLIFDRLTFDSSGDFVDGCRPTDSLIGFCRAADANPNDPASRYAVGEYFAADRSHLLVVNNSRTTYAAYFVEVGTNDFRGEVSVYSKGSTPSVFHPVRGFRSASRSFVQEGIGPSKAARTPRPLPLSESAGGGSAKALPAAQLHHLRTLEARIEAAQRAD